MKPGYTSYSNFTVTNTGTNPVNVWKAVTFGTTTVNTQSEAGCIARGGTWNNGCTGGTPADLGAVVDHSLSVKVFYSGNNNEAAPDWFQTIYADTDNHLISSDVAPGNLLGMLPVGAKMEVTEDFYMDPAAGNQYQGEGTTFNITLTGEQLINTVTMVHKTGTNLDKIDQASSAKAVLAYKEQNDAFNYDLTVNGLTAGTNYVVVAGTNPYTGGAIELAAFTTNGSGNYSVTGQTEDLNADLTNAKVWVIPASDWTGTVGTVGTMTWSNGANYLFETALVDYTDPIH
jgi:hypothetical protein